MQANKTMQPSVLAAIADVRQEYQKGGLQAYEPLKISGVGYDYATCMTSWGPLMKT